VCHYIAVCRRSNTSQKASNIANEQNQASQTRRESKRFFFFSGGEQRKSAEEKQENVLTNQRIIAGEQRMNGSRVKKNLFGGGRQEELQRRQRKNFSVLAAKFDRSAMSWGDRTFITVFLLPEAVFVNMGKLSCPLPSQ
jgi:hypothetical protein